jgi:hypothetical protein
MNSDMSYQDSYRVEVSGWDAKESFFIEKTALEWTPEDKKAIMLRAPIRTGSIVFVRLLQPMGAGPRMDAGGFEAAAGAGLGCLNDARHNSCHRLLILSAVVPQSGASISSTRHSPCALRVATTFHCSCTPRYATTRSAAPAMSPSAPASTSAPAAPRPCPSSPRCTRRHLPAR